MDENGRITAFGGQVAKKTLFFGAMFGGPYSLAS
jgi:hypothetical protein